MRITSVVGARPQFVKAVMVSGALREHAIEERMVHTGQHYDAHMSKIFFDELNIPEPAVNLGIGSGTHGMQTSAAMQALERDFTKNPADAVLVYGDTNSTLAGALAASKLNIPVFHVEAGLRSFNRAMPEEINRVVSDHVSSLLFAPTEAAVINLKKEGLMEGVFLTGDVMCDALRLFAPAAEKKSGILKRLKIKAGEYQLLTLHRPSNVDEGKRLEKYLEIISDAGIPTVFPVHPRTERELGSLCGRFEKWIRFIPPVGYLDMLMLEKNAVRILTDSGGVQKEAYMQKVPCMTLRAETEWVETALAGWNQIAGEDPRGLKRLLQNPPLPGPWRAFYGEGEAAQRIAEQILKQSKV